MKAGIWLTCLILVGMGAFGQRAGGLGHHSGGPPATAPIPRGHTNPPAGAASPRSRFAGSGSDRFISPYGYPLLLGDYAYPPGYDANYQPTPSFVVAPPPPVYLADEPAPAPRSDIREYKPSNPQTATAAEQSNFAIALKDGSVRSAIAVFVQGNMVAYVDPDGRQQRVPGDAVDRDTTKRLNQALKINLYLPPPSR